MTHTDPAPHTDGFEELPQPAARPSRRRLAVLGLVAAGGIAAGGTFALVSAAGASAPGSTGPTGTSAPAAGTSTSAAPANCGPGAGPGRGPAGRPGTPEKLPAGDFDGTVTAVSSSSITVKAPDGTSRTYAITSKTTVHSGPGTSSKVSSLATGQHVHIRGSKSGSSYTATDIDRMPKGPRGGPHGGPAGRPPMGGPAALPGGKAPNAPKAPKAPATGTTPSGTSSGAPSSVPAPSTSTSG